MSVLGFFVAALYFGHAAGAGTIQHVIQISMDGLRPDAITALSAAELPNFYRLRNEGAFTDNARTDVDRTTTTYNHVDMVTSRGRDGPAGASNDWADPWAPGDTLHAKKGSYVPGVFDVVHDHGLRTGFYVSKPKLGLFVDSWDDVNGAIDVTGADNGRDKIDVDFINSTGYKLVDAWELDTTTIPQHYSFIHFAGPDTAGHTYDYMSAEYLDAVKTMDGYLGDIFDVLDTNPTFTGKTAVIVTSDHGGHNDTHGAIIPEDYTIPFYVWGPGVAAGADLYALNPTTRSDPGTSMPDWSAAPQPIRNGDVANLALDLLDLEPIPGSGINNLQDLAVPEPSGLMLAWLGVAGLALFAWRRGR